MIFIENKNKPRTPKWKKNRRKLTVGKVLLVYEINIQVLPTAPSPTVTHFINLDALISKHQIWTPETTMRNNSKWVLFRIDCSWGTARERRKKKKEEIRKSRETHERVMLGDLNCWKWREIPNCRSREGKREGKWGLERERRERWKMGLILKRRKEMKCGWSARRPSPPSASYTTSSSSFYHKILTPFSFLFNFTKFLLFLLYSIIILVDIL